jgi:hypothetical protein
MSPENFSAASPDEIVQEITQVEQLGMKEKVMAAATLGSMYAWGHVGYAVEIASGKALEHAGVNPWLAAGAVAVATTAETLGMSYAATKGIGDFEVTPQNQVTRTLAKSAVLSPVQSLWSGAPAGVMTDKMFGREVTLKRRLLHSVPYGTAVGFWVAPTAPTEFVTGTVEHVVREGMHEASTHPAASSALVGAAVLVAAGMKFQARSARDTR